MSKVSVILAQISEGVNFSQSNDFFADGMLDSFDLITLVSELDQAYGISIDGLDIIPTNFCSVVAIEALLTRNGVTP